MRAFRFSTWLLCVVAALSAALAPTVSCFADGSSAADFNRAIQARAEQRRKAEQRKAEQRKAEEARKAEQARRKQAEQRRKAEQARQERQAAPESGRDEGAEVAPPMPPPPTKTVALPTRSNSLGIEFVLIPAGSFIMGCDTETGADCYTNEMPAHRVTISRPFYLARHEVTQAQWDQVMGKNPSANKGMSLPVDSVSWDEAQEFIDRLNRRAGERRYRLPSEAEWEYAARAGSEGVFSFGDDPRWLAEFGWCDSHAGGRTHQVGQRRPNAWGLYDMHGNVSEWVQDQYSAHYYAESPGVDPIGPDMGEGRVRADRVNRGGGWKHPASLCRSAARSWARPNTHLRWVGFRLAMEPGS